MDRHQQIGDGDGMREVDEVRMFPEQLERTPEKILCSETREEREERERCADGVEDAERRELMRRIDTLKRRVAVHEDELVVPREERTETDDTKRVEPPCVSLHPCAERIEMQSDIAAEQEDKDIVHDPVVQSIEEQRAQECPLRQSVDVEIERRVKARPVVKRNLHDEDSCEQRQCHTRKEHAPERHQQIEPNQDHHEVELVLRISEEEDPRQCNERWKADSVCICVVQKIEERPHEVGDHNRTSAPHEKIPIV